LGFEQPEFAAEPANRDKELQVKVAMNAEDNLTEERIKTAELTLDEVKLRKEQEETAIQLNQATQRNLGA
jgi:ABC-type branched-subunit amino acid transport system ATPase component